MNIKGNNLQKTPKGWRCFYCNSNELVDSDSDIQRVLVSFSVLVGFHSSLGLIEPYFEFYASLLQRRISVNGFVKKGSSLQFHLQLHSMQILRRIVRLV